MDKKENKPTDLLGIAPYGEAIKLAVEKGFEGASALLSRICLPAAEELGLMLKDKMRYWRLNNIIKIVNKSKGKLNFDGNELQLSVHPRIINEVMEAGSWCDDDNLQEMWAGLLKSSCDIGITNDSNLLFVNTLKQLTSIQAKLINYICGKCNVGIYQNGFLTGDVLHLSLEDLYIITECNDLDRLDIEMDSLRANELLGAGGGGFTAGTTPIIASLKPTAYLLQFFSKTQGYTGPTKDFYKDRLIIVDDNNLKIFGNRYLMV